LLVVCNTANTSYKKAVERWEEWLADFNGRPVCRETLGSWASATVENEENEADKLQEPPNKKEREKTKRKSMKGFKRWTGMADEGERKFKGWSDNGHKAFVQRAACSMHMPSKRMWREADALFGRRPSKDFCDAMRGKVE
jgi:hypothetical protein